MVSELTPRPWKPRLPSWFLSALPGLAVAIGLSSQFRNTPPLSDGAIYFTFAQNAWDLPLKAENFWASWAHKESYVSIGLLGLTYHVGLDPITALRVLQFGVFASAIVAFSFICHRVFRGIETFEAGLLTLVFSVTPAYLAYFVGVATDFVALAFLLVYLAALCARNFTVAALVGTAFAFCKETSFLAYSLTLPLVLVYSMRRFGSLGSSWPTLTRAAFFLPYPLKGMHHLAHGAEELGETLRYCQHDSLGSFLLSSNLGRPEIQNYLFDLFVLNFQWLLLIPVGVGLAELIRRLMNNRAALISNPEEVNWAALGLIFGFLAAGLYVITRCPIFNNVKYVIQSMPLWMLMGYWLSLYAFPARIWRTRFFLGVLLLFCASTARSFDPLSLGFFGSFDGEPHTMLCMNSRARLPEEHLCGNDEMIYNLQPFIFF